MYINVRERAKENFFVDMLDMLNMLLLDTMSIVLFLSGRAFYLQSFSDYPLFFFMEWHAA